MAAATTDACINDYYYDERELQTALENERNHLIHTISNNSVTVESINILVAMKVFKHLKLDFKMLYDLKSQIQIDSNIKQRLKDLWVCSRHTPDENRAYKELGSKPFFRIPELVKLVTRLEKAFETLPPSILAMDGFEGLRPKSYVRNLKYGSNTLEEESIEELHVRAVRELYDMYPQKLNAEKMRGFLCGMFFEEQQDNNLDEEMRSCMSKIYCTIVGDSYMKIAELKKQRETKRRTIEMRRSIAAKRAKHQSDSDKDDE